MSSVKVAVRVRPFNARELAMEGNKLCISMSGNTTTIMNPDPRSGDKSSFSFTFDYSYWSHDDFDEQEDGYCKPKKNSHYADQEKVYQDMGKEVLDNAFQGYNACLFAYGQTGSGKSYSMIGYKKNVGIVPKICLEIFDRIEKEKNASKEVKKVYEVHVSMMEIYNEQIHDLLIPPQQRKKGGLKVRQDNKQQVYVEDLSKHSVESYEHIQMKLEEGTNNRTIGSTLMNSTSSRAHTIFTITLKQTQFDSNSTPVMQTTAEIHLVDLAGSERTGSTGANGIRLREGCSINQSLSTLGNVISALADKAEGKGMNRIIPYRDSVLTRILQNAFGGNCKTAMIASLSPSSVNFEETLSTLRYANRVKEIKTVAVKNESPMERMIRELKEENEKLKLIALRGGDGHAGEDSGEVEALRKRYEEQLQQVTKSYETRLKEKQESSAVLVRQNTLQNRVDALAILKNINQDPLLSGRILHPLRQGVVVFGKNESEMGESNFVSLGGLGVAAQHAQVELVQPNGDDGDEDDFEVFLSALQGKTHVNGALLEKGTRVKLRHKDIILFGNHHLYIYMDSTNLDQNIPSWEEATKDINRTESAQIVDVSRSDGAGPVDFEMKEKLLQKEKTLAEERDKIEKERVKMTQLFAAKERDALLRPKMEARLLRDTIKLEKERQEAFLLKKEKELEQKMENMKILQEEKKKKEEQQLKSKQLLAELVARTLFLVEEANTLASELNKPILFSICLQPRLDSTDNRFAFDTPLDDLSQFSSVEVVIKVEQLEEDIVYYWPLNVFEERLFAMRETYSDTLTGGPTEHGEEGEEDPFAPDVSTYVRIGSSWLFLDSIRSLLSINKQSLTILDHQGKSCGNLLVSLFLSLHDEEGSQKKEGQKKGELEEEDDKGVFFDEALLDYNELNDLEGHVLKFSIHIESANNIPPNLCRGCEIIFTWVDGVTEIRTLCVGGRDTILRNPKFFYSRDFVVPINAETLRWFSSPLKFDVQALPVDVRTRSIAFSKSSNVSRKNTDTWSDAAFLEGENGPGDMGSLTEMGDLGDLGEIGDTTDMGDAERETFKSLRGEILALQNALHQKNLVLSRMKKKSRANTVTFQSNDTSNAS